MVTNLEFDQKKLPGIVCDEHPEWIDFYTAAWRTAFDNIEYPENNGWLPQMTCMPGQGVIWQWDSCFMSFIGKYSNGMISAMNNIDNLYRLQRRDGYISMAYCMETEENAYDERINPPLYAWAEWEYFRTTGDGSRLEHVLPLLVDYYRWIKSNRTRVNGLYWFEDSGSSGMDNSPRSGYYASKLDGSDVCFIDLACQQALSACCISKMAERVGNHEIQSAFSEEYEALCQLINEKHWCEKYGFYYDLFCRSEKDLLNKFINHKTAAAFWTIISGVANERQINRLIEHIINPEEFMTPHPVPTLSKDDPNYEPLGGYWLGSVWAPTNYMLVKGLKNTGRSYLAREIALKHLNAMIEVARNENYDSIWECYSPEYMRPATCEGGKIVRANFVGWSGLGPVTMLIENILGFDFDALNNKITWAICTKGKHGIENIHFNSKVITLICHGWSSRRNETRISIETTGEIRLAICFIGDSMNPGHEYVFPAGIHDICI